MCSQADPKSQEVCHACIYTQPPLIPIQLGLESCGFCGGDECTIKLDPTGHEDHKIISSCRYAYLSPNYKRAKLPTKSSPCANIFIVCSFCNSPTGSHSIWKVQRDHGHGSKSGKATPSRIPGANTYIPHGDAADEDGSRCDEIVPEGA